MKYSIAFGTLLAILPCVHSQSGAYGQCGGTGWSESTYAIFGLKADRICSWCNDVCRWLHMHILKPVL